MVRARSQGSMDRMLGWLMLACLALTGRAFADGLDAHLDRAVIAQDETVQLVLSTPGQNPAGTPDLTPLESDFTIQGTSQSTRVNILNGRVDARTEWNVTLAPRHSGEIEIPPIALGSVRSRPLSLRVEPAGSKAAAGPADGIFLEAEVEPREPYVQGQVLYTVRLFHAVPLREGSLTAPRAQDAIVQQLGDDVTYEKQRNGRRYQVIERRYALFPQHSGKLTIDPPVFTGKVPAPRGRRDSLMERFFGNVPPAFDNDPLDLMFESTRSVRASAAAATLDVRPRPAGTGDGPWLPAEDLRLSERWSPDPPVFRVGEPVTRTVTITARGLTAEQLPEVRLAPDAEIRVYPDRPELDTNVQAKTVVGKRVARAALVPNRAGSLTLPALQVRWWDSKADQLRTAILPARTIEVLPAIGRAPSSPTVTQPDAATASPEPAAHAPSGADNPAPGSAATAQTPAVLWQWTSAALLVAWLATLVLWRVDRRHRRPSERQQPVGAVRRASFGEARRQVRRACAERDPQAAKRALLAWARAQWPANPPLTLAALANHSEDGPWRGALLHLERVLYGDGAERWDPAPLLDLFSERREKTDASAHGAPAPSALPALYPEY